MPGFAAYTLPERLRLKFVRFVMELGDDIGVTCPEMPLPQRRALMIDIIKRMTDIYENLYHVE